MATDIPVFGLLVTSALGFKARVDSFACVLLSPAHNRFLRFTSAVTPADLLVVSMTAKLSHPCTCVQSLVGIYQALVQVAAASLN